MSAERLRETFRAYVAAEGAATRAFLAYKFGEVTEAHVHRLQRLEKAAADAHIEAIDAVSAPSDPHLGVTA